MWLEESGVIVEIVARAKEPDEAAAAGDENFGFDKSDLRARVIMISEYLKVAANLLVESLNVSSRLSNCFFGLCEHLFMFMFC